MFKIGDRVKVDMPGRDGKPLYGTVLNPNFLGFSILVRCDSQVDKRYCYTDSLEVPFLPHLLDLLL